ncbi:hypothetical protein [Sporanaerobacter acetigenes]|uniref:Coenzyme PQQ synthesis protein D (PqqD) n=1 Tax=Sporanaerobacter acetigenes DSM 13106 TaxID=1123281 RepID=A0A1M5Z8S5_9FIRM|nr:hypothetical protein [Sporanaerobacter acetigenes]SHI20636.1 hypothetical protein SAMN02745180_02865 [Sporanaerobacter acetigenes DSM 13106]
MLEKLYNNCLEYKLDNIEVPNSLITNFKLKEDLQVVFKDNKGWVFDYHNSVLYNLNQVASLFVYMTQKGHLYKECVALISNYYKIPVPRVDSDLQSLINNMLKYELLILGK